MIADPYPAHLSEMDETPQVDPVVTALNRIAAAIERMASQPVQNAPGAALAALPPVRPSATPQAAAGGVCPIHGTPWKTVPAGTSQRTGKAYAAFQACSTAGCDQRPPR